MDKFSRWADIALPILSHSHSAIKRGQVIECLAAWLGHKTYASLRVSDLVALSAGAKYVIIDSRAAMARAAGFGFAVTPDQWLKVEMALKPSGISGGLWLVPFDGMQHAATLTFEDGRHPDIEAIWKPIGMPDGRSASYPLKEPMTADISAVPGDLTIGVHGWIRAFGSNVSLEVPIRAAVIFKRLGRRIFAKGEILSVKQIGQPRSYEHEDDGGEIYGMSED